MTSAELSDADWLAEERHHEAQSIGALADGFRATDAGNADRFVAAAAGRARFVHAWQKWIVYEPRGVWSIDTGDALIGELAKHVARRMFQRAIEVDGTDREQLWKWAKRSESASAIRAMILLARGIPGVIVSHEDLDADPWLLNVENGTLDLRTGALRPHDPDDLITLQAPVMFDPDAAADLWHACISRWLPDVDVRQYVQRVAGSGATGIPVEHLVVNVGGGANGKSKLWGTIAAILGPYAVIPHKSLITVQRHEQHDTTKARLFRARLAIASETDAGDRLDEAKVKSLTGGDHLEARRMREDPWKFTPSHTFVMHTNHRPRVRGNDEGIWRRLRLVPWTVTIPEHERDDHLADKLLAEAPGILNWIVAGTADWLAHGFNEPAAVQAATADYRADEDHIAAFLAATCRLVPEHRVATAQLGAVYTEWCTAAGEQPLSATAFGRALTERGILPTRDKRARIGLRLLDDDERAAVAAVSPFPTRAHAHGGLTGKPPQPPHPLSHNGEQAALDLDRPPFDPYEEPPDDLGAWTSDPWPEVDQ